MALIARILSIALLSLPFCAVSASAECAWVLWYEQAEILFPKDAPLSSSMSWGLVQAASSEAECRRALSAEVKGRSQPSENRKIMSGESSVHETIFQINDGRRQLVSMTDFRYVCLPDTVDPRGPKGK